MRLSGDDFYVLSVVLAGVLAELLWLSLLVKSVISLLAAT